ncbi:hypothetical protein RUESEDTHA_00840 [Ruegeria sp. THAF57]|uniref:DUF3168 domain-containing protein n=1 Tax=Ruegeria sp. THAF57 TaxID=2744555 RepID=UPI0015E046EA|nr:DUF3168 domain-containing protein [Ruegeria sp. THAF57]CAD0183963.1 hypothetical protein RUESEDTHA_00840 [Ruegeria sp. THAF57]
MSLDLATQKAIRARLVATQAVTNLVPALNILDRNQRSAPSPSIILEESQVVDEGSSLQRKHSRVFHTFHIWKREPSLDGVKRICGAVRNALNWGRINLDSGYQAADIKVSSMRFIRVGDGEISHGIVTVELLVNEVA